MTSVRDDPFTAFRKVREWGFPTCQLGNPPDDYVYGPRAAERTEQVRAAIAESGVRVTSVFIMFQGDAGT